MSPENEAIDHDAAERTLRLNIPPDPTHSNMAPQACKRVVTLGKRAVALRCLLSASALLRCDPPCWTAEEKLDPAGPNGVGCAEFLGICSVQTTAQSDCSGWCRDSQSIWRNTTLEIPSSMVEGGRAPYTSKDSPPSGRASPSSRIGRASRAQEPLVHLRSSAVVGRRRIARFLR